MIAYRDFVPRELSKDGLLINLLIKRVSYEPFAAAVATANQWIRQESIQVLNVETVVLPGIWEPAPKAEGPDTEDADITATGSVSGNQFVRVWYRTA